MRKDSRSNADMANLYCNSDIVLAFIIKEDEGVSKMGAHGYCIYSKAWAVHRLLRFLFVIFRGKS